MKIAGIALEQIDTDWTSEKNENPSNGQGGANEQRQQNKGILERELEQAIEINKMWRPDQFFFIWFV